MCRNYFKARTSSKRNYFITDMTLRVIFVGWMETVLECVDSIKINSIPYGRTQSRRPIDGRNSKWHRMISILILRERLPGHQS